MGDISKFTRRLLRLGHSLESANHIVAMHLSRGALDELDDYIERQLKAVTA